MRVRLDEDLRHLYKKMREHSGLSIKEFANSIGLTRYEVYDIENRKKSMSEKNKKCYDSFLDIFLKDFNMLMMTGEQVNNVATVTLTKENKKSFLDIRQQTGMSQSNFSKAFGLSIATISRIESMNLEANSSFNINTLSSLLSKVKDVFVPEKISTYLFNKYLKSLPKEITIGLKTIGKRTDFGHLKKEKSVKLVNFDINKKLKNKKKYSTGVSKSKSDIKKSQLISDTKKAMSNAGLTVHYLSLMTGPVKVSTSEMSQWLSGNGLLLPEQELHISKIIKPFLKVANKSNDDIIIQKLDDILEFTNDFHLIRKSLLKAIK